MTPRSLSVLAAACVCLLLAGCGQPFYAPAVMATPVTYFQAPQGGKPVRLAVREVGRGKPMLLLHGLGASSYTWHAILPQLAKTHRVIALDLKGFGDSDKPLDEAYSLSDQAKLVQEFIVRSDLRDVTLVGHSFGGGVALALALQQAETGERRVSKLVLIDSIAYRQPTPLFFSLLQTPILGEIGLSLIPPGVQAERALEVAYHHDWKVKPQTVASYASPLHSAGGRHALLRTVQSLTSENPDLFAARYPTLRLPALLIWCDHDKIVPLRYGKRLAKDLPNARIEVIEECGHIPQEEQPAETVAAIQRFAAAAR